MLVWICICMWAPTTVNYICIYVCITICCHLAPVERWFCTKSSQVPLEFAYCSPLSCVDSPLPTLLRSLSTKQPVNRTTSTDDLMPLFATGVITLFLLLIVVVVVAVCFWHNILMLRIYHNGVYSRGYLLAITIHIVKFFETKFKLKYKLTPMRWGWVWSASKECFIEMPHDKSNSEGITIACCVGFSVGGSLKPLAAIRWYRGQKLLMLNFSRLSRLSYYFFEKFNRHIFEAFYLDYLVSE